VRICKGYQSRQKKRALASHGIGWPAQTADEDVEQVLFYSGVVSLVEASYAVAPSLTATASYQRQSAPLSAGMDGLSARVARSTVAKVVPVQHVVDPACRRCQRRLPDIQTPAPVNLPMSGPTFKAAGVARPFRPPGFG
jgi:hypothetical protein